jgi:hypothetical protein
MTESVYLVPRLDLHEHLLTRVSALKALIECIYKNGLNSQVYIRISCSVSNNCELTLIALQTGVIIPSELCTNFETMNAASALWTLITNYP